MPIKKLQALPKTLLQALLQALKNYYNNYFSRHNIRNACINRRGYWQMLAVAFPCYILVFDMVDYLDRTFASPFDRPYDFTFQSLISSPYLILFLFVLLFLFVILFFFLIIADHRCRDIGISRLYILLLLLPFINIAFLIILGCLKTGAVKKHSLRKNKKTDRSKILLQALKDYYNKYFSRGNYRNACIDRRGYWQMLVVFLPYHILVVNIVDYLSRNFASRHSFDFQAFVSWPYFIPSCLLLLFYGVIIVLFFTIVFHRCRDIGISRWYTLLVFLPYIKIAFLIVLGCLEKDAVEKYRKKYRKKYGLRKNKKTDL